MPGSSRSSTVSGLSKKYPGTDKKRGMSKFCALTYNTLELRLMGCEETAFDMPIEALHTLIK